MFMNVYFVSGIVSVVVFMLDDVGWIVSIWYIVFFVDIWGQVMIMVYMNFYIVIVNVVLVFIVISVSDMWFFGVFLVIEGYPGTVAFYEECFVFVSLVNDLQIIWLSCFNDYESFFIGDEDDDLMILILVFDQVNVICWMVQGCKLFIGFFGGEWILGGSIEIEVLIFMNINVKC